MNMAVFHSALPHCAPVDVDASDVPVLTVYSDVRVLHTCSPSPPPNPPPVKLLPVRSFIGKSCPKIFSLWLL
uniref:Uncharacterized protein n=1 Tax=Anguilla anguilla TaxID=7936 RepID=A0A0E9WN88_ANGAN